MSNRNFRDLVAVRICDLVCSAIVNLYNPNVLHVLFAGVDAVRPSQHFSVMSERFFDRGITKQKITCLAQARNTVPPTKLEPAIPSLKHHAFQIVHVHEAREPFIY